MDIDEEEARALLDMQKISMSTGPIELPDLGGRVDMQFASADRREEFSISFNRSSISLEKRSHHLLGRKVIGLARLDLDGPGHRNPDGVEVGPRHLHVYRAGYGLKFAIDVPQHLFPNLEDSFLTLEDFFRYCNVVTPPTINRGLFSQ